MKDMSLNELKELPALTEKEINVIEHARAIPSDDCPEMSYEELKQFHPWYDRQKQSVTINVDILNK